jgi:hypothetical protein
MRLEDNEVKNRVRSVFVQATSEDPGAKPTTLFNVGEGPVSHIEISSRPGETTKCRIYLRDRRRDSEGGDNYWLEGLRADTFLQGLRNVGAYPDAAEVAFGAGATHSQRR